LDGCLKREMIAVKLMQGEYFLPMPDWK